MKNENEIKAKFISLHYGQRCLRFNYHPHVELIYAVTHLSDQDLECAYLQLRDVANWPDDKVYAAAIVSEESGELMRSAVQVEMEDGDIEEMRKEAVQTAATCIRLIKNL